MGIPWSDILGMAMAVIPVAIDLKLCPLQMGIDSLSMLYSLK